VSGCIRASSCGGDAATRRQTTHSDSWNHVCPLLEIQNVVDASFYEGTPKISSKVGSVTLVASNAYRFPHSTILYSYYTKGCHLMLVGLVWAHVSSCGSSTLVCHWGINHILCGSLLTWRSAVTVVIYWIRSRRRICVDDWLIMLGDGLTLRQVATSAIAACKRIRNMDGRFHPRPVNVTDRRVNSVHYSTKATWPLATILTRMGHWHYIGKSRCKISWCRSCRWSNIYGLQYCNESSLCTTRYYTSYSPVAWYTKTPFANNWTQLTLYFQLR